MDAPPVENTTGSAQMKKFLIIAVAALLIFSFIKIKNPVNVPKIKDADITPEQESRGEGITQELRSFSISGFSEDGKNRWQVEGESADILSETVNMRAIKAKSSGKKIGMVLTADEGTFFKTSKDVELRKNVIANTDEGTTLKADKLKWLAETERIVTDDYVYIQREDIDVSGRGVEATPAMKKVQLNRDIKMTIHSALVKKDGSGDTGKAGAERETVITCDGPLEVDYQNHFSIFNKNVIVEDKEGRIFADKVIAYIDPEQRKLSKVVAKGNVKIIHRQNISYSDEAIYLANEGRVILAGRPKVVIYSTDELMKAAEGTNESL